MLTPVKPANESFRNWCSGGCMGCTDTDVDVFVTYLGQGWEGNTGHSEVIQIFEGPHSTKPHQQFYPKYPRFAASLPSAAINSLNFEFWTKTWTWDLKLCLPNLVCLSHTACPLSQWISDCAVVCVHWQLFVDYEAFKMSHVHWNKQFALYSSSTNSQ